MRTVRVDALDNDFSVLGFGCASLGSMVSASAGLRAIDLALHLGVNWFDVAPNYGGGNAEILLGEALRVNRRSVAICTKISVLPPFQNPIPPFLRPAARWMMKAAPIGWQAARSRRRLRAERPRLDAAFIERSLIASLKRLQTDYVDVVALHDPDVSESTAPDIIEALERVLEKGYARTAAIAGSLDAVIEGVSKSDLFRVVQIRDGFLTRARVVERIMCTPNRNPLVVTHGAFSDLYLEKRARRMLAESGHSRAEFSQRALNFALSKNPNGIVVASMFSLDHIRANCGVSARAFDTDAALKFAQRFANS
jgi:aryl-alcohol dehydrogenase-like predicted oxidoreductase